MTQKAQWVRLDGAGVCLVFALEEGGGADLIYIGDALPKDEDLASLAHANARARHESQSDAPPCPGLLPQGQGGSSVAPAVVFSANGARIDTDFRLLQWQSSAQNLKLNFKDRLSQLEAQIEWDVGDRSIISSALRITNPSAIPVTVERASAIALPVPRRFTEVTSFSGRWAGEMHEDRRTIAPTGFARSSYAGKSGFSGGNWLILHDPLSGEAMAAHLEWSGDYDTRIDCDNQGAGDGRAVLQMGPALRAREVVLEQGHAFQGPLAIVAIARDEDTLTRNFHAEIRANVIAYRDNNAQRLVHLNTWEALGFDLSNEAIMRLADDAADLGVERFVLDDGWFGARRNDQTSLGDWRVAPHLDLPAIIAHVRSLNMDFGLWVEPEMVSPDSDLYRAHPDWCLHIEGQERPTMRGQLVLDLTRQEVRDYVVGAVETLLTTYEIAYLKWDHNRDLFPRGRKAHRQTEALYDMLAQLRAAFPHVMIESCSSGGGRIDTGIMRYTSRVWPSDNNDPIERVRIMQGWSRFLPLEVMGNHVGPSPNPITGRQTAMVFRAKIALFGHMGVEADPAAMSQEDRATLKAHIALYKQWRWLLHSGEYYRLDHPDEGIFAHMVAGETQTLAMAAQTRFCAEFDPAPLRLKGLDPKARYRVTLPNPWPAKGSLYLSDWERWSRGLVLSGAALMNQGLALPLTHPETAWLIALEKLT